MHGNRKTTDPDLEVVWNGTLDAQELCPALTSDYLTISSLSTPEERLEPPKPQIGRPRQSPIVYASLDDEPSDPTPAIVAMRAPLPKSQAPREGDRRRGAKVLHTVTHAEPPPTLRGAPAAVLAAIHRLGSGGHTTAQVAAATGYNFRTTENAIGALRRMGLVTTTRTDTNHPLRDVA